jgi:hypothetical protein
MKTFQQFCEDNSNIETRRSVIRSANDQKSAEKREQLAANQEQQRLSAQEKLQQSADEQKKAAEEESRQRQINNLRKRISDIENQQ